MTAKDLQFGLDLFKRTYNVYKSCTYAFKLVIVSI